MEDKGDFWYTIWEGYVREAGKHGSEAVPECSFFGTYGEESFTFSYIGGIYQPRKITTRNTVLGASVVGMEIADNQVSWYENGQLRGTTQLPGRPFYLTYCTPYSDTQVKNFSFWHALFRFSCLRTSILRPKSNAVLLLWNMRPLKNVLLLTISIRVSCRKFYSNKVLHYS